MENEEIWKDVIGYEGRYQASSMGRIKSLERIVKSGRGPKIKKEIILRPGDSDGYFMVVLYKEAIKKQYKIHKLIAATFILNHENKPVINHINGVKKDNRVENLEWCTISENVQHAFDIGLHKIRTGEDHHSSTVTKEQALILIDAKNKYSNGTRKWGLKKLTEEMGINISTARAIIGGRNWAHLQNK